MNKSVVRIISNRMMHIRCLVWYWSLFYHLGEKCISISVSSRNLQFNSPILDSRSAVPANVLISVDGKFIVQLLSLTFSHSPHKSLRKTFRFHFLLPAVLLQAIIIFPLGDCSGLLTYPPEFSLDPLELIFNKANIVVFQKCMTEQFTPTHEPPVVLHFPQSKWLTWLCVWSEAVSIASALCDLLSAFSPLTHFSRCLPYFP